MKIAVYGKTFNQGFRPYITELLDVLEEHNTDLVVFKPFFDFICCETCKEYKVQKIFTSLDDYDSSCDIMVSIGGDGTFLETIPYVIRQSTPIIGINSGRLGFLSNISKENIRTAFDNILERHYGFEYRHLIEFSSPPGLFNGMNYALNDITIHKGGSPMITVDAFINQEFLNTYYTDGLIISTPTGSTAYSLSVGGPVVVPGTGSLIIAPIAPHNLTVRPLVIPDSSIITLKVHSRSGKFLVTADNRTQNMSTDVDFEIIKSDFTLKLLKLPDTSFYTTLRDKLKWGEDVRN
jgi:NAD+ kinase